MYDDNELVLVDGWRGAKPNGSHKVEEHMVNQVQATGERLCRGDFPTWLILSLLELERATSHHMPGQDGTV